MTNVSALVSSRGLTSVGMADTDGAPWARAVASTS